VDGKQLVFVSLENKLRLGDTELVEGFSVGGGDSGGRQETNGYAKTS